MNPVGDVAAAARSETLAGSRTRPLAGAPAALVTLVALAMVAFHVVVLFFYPIDPLLFRAGHVAFAGTLVFLLYPAVGTPGRGLSAVDVLLALGGWGVCAYVIADFDGLMERVGVEPNLSDVLLGGLALLLVLEMTRRLSGWVLPILALVLLAYAVVGGHLPGLLRHKGYSIERTISFLFGPDGLYGQPVAASASYVFFFVVFGALLQAAGCAQFFVDLARSTAGGARGGPAKMSLVSSSLFGTVSGSSVANVVVDGVINIPLMKASGFRRDIAAAIEAVASTGGQIVPPVMGAAAFVMAEVLGLPYGQIAAAAVLPALLYYSANFWMIDFQAARDGLRGLPRADLPPLGRLLRADGVLLTPLVILLVALMAFDLSPFLAAGLAMLATLALGALRGANRLTPGRVVSALADGARGSLDVAATTATAGIVVGVLALTGLGLKFGMLVVSYSGGSLVLALILAMLVSLILGMGMPTTPAYVLAASSVTPGLVELGLHPFAAHFFVFYFACLSSITPPVALAAYAAAAIAEANMWRVGWQALRFGAAGFLVPYACVFGPALLLRDSWSAIALAAVTGLLGTAALAGALQGWWFGPAAWSQRALLAVAALALIKPGMYTDGLGVVLLLIVAAWQRARRRGRPDGGLRDRGAVAPNREV